MASPLVPRTGQTVRGLPVSLNRAPPPHLARYVARFFITIVDQPGDHLVEDFLLNETAFMRVLVRGDWDAFVDGEWQRYDGPLLFGAQSKPLRVRVRGPLATAGFGILPGAWQALTGGSAEAVIDRLAALEGALGDSFARATARIDDHEATFAAMIEAAAIWAGATIGAIDPVAEAFERLVHLDPVRPVADIARAIGVSPRTLDRRVRAAFGIAPKLVLRRSRFLDMAAVVRGLVVADEETLAALRFYDQSHRGREFRRFAGMTPVAFDRAQTPLLTLGIESRQRRKLENTLSFGGHVPWLG